MSLMIFAQNDHKDCSFFFFFFSSMHANARGIPKQQLEASKQYCYHIQSFGDQIDGLVQDCSNSIANAMELLQCCTKPSKLSFILWVK